MKKITLLGAALAMASLSAFSQGTIQMTTAAPQGTTIKILPNAVSATQPITIDFGNGVEQKYTVDPSIPAYQRWIEATIEGSYITVKGNLTEFDLGEAQLTSVSISNMSSLSTLKLDNNEIESFELLTPTPLKQLDLSHNKIQNSPTNNPSLTLEQCGSTLTNLTLSYNEGLQCLDIRDLRCIEYLSAYNNPDLGSIFICMPEEAQTTIRQINLSNCSLTNFYPIGLPNLTSLDLSNNQLMTVGTDNPFRLGDYPKLASLSVNGNKWIDALDITKCTKLEKLYINDCRFETIDVSQCPELHTINAANNQLTSLDLGNNPLISTIYIQGNPISEFDVSKFQNLTSLNISNTDISRVNLMNAYFLKDFSASGTKLEFIDFNGQQSNRITKIDIRNNPNFTYESMAYTLSTLPAARKAYSTNLWIEGSNADKSNTDYLKGSDMQWIPDVEGDGSAVFSPLAVTLQGATDTGENKTGVVDRLYPLFAYSMPYDLDVMQTEGGKFIICQWQPEWFQTMESVHDSALKGVPICVYAYPDEDKRFKSVTVNGTEIYSPWFILSEDATVKVNFTGAESSVSFDVEPGQDFTFLVNTVNNNGSVWVDWGTGVRTEYRGQRAYETGVVRIGGTRIDGTTASNKVTVYGDIAAIDVSGFGDVAADFGLWDNHITGVDLSSCPELRLFNGYWNPISSIDLSQNPKLMVLNVSYTDLKELDLSNNPNLCYLEAYSDGWGEDGISMLTSLDLTKLPILQYLNVKNNEFTSLDLSQNPYLYYAQLYGNNLTSIDVSQNPDLEELYLGDNKLTSIDVSKNTKLVELSLDGNDISTIDVSNNTELESLSLANCKLTALDTHMLAKLQRLWINGNGLTADQLNDIYYLLPVRQDNGEEGNPGLSSYNLYIIQGGDKVENDGLRADSSIAVYRQWDPSHKGSNGGSDYSYFDVFTPYHGTVTVTDEAGNVYTSGSKVPKYTKLTITPKADPDYVYSSFSLNGEEAQSGFTFDMPGIYTRLSCSFIKDSAVEGVYADGTSIRGMQGGVSICAPQGTADIYNAAGLCMAAEVSIEGETFVQLQKGMYIVRLTAGENVHTLSVIVK